MVWFNINVSKVNIEFYFRLETMMIKMHTTQNLKTNGQRLDLDKVLIKQKTTTKIKSIKIEGMCDD